MDIVILHEKYQAVNRLIAYWDELADWIEKRSRMAAELQQQPDEAAFMDELLRIVYQSQVPGPPVEFVLDELHGVIKERPDLLAAAELDHQQRHFVMQVIKLVCKEIDLFRRDELPALLRGTDRIVKLEVIVSDSEQYPGQGLEARHTIVNVGPEVEAAAPSTTLPAGTLIDDLQQYIGLIAQELRRTSQVGKIVRDALDKQLAGSSRLKWSDLTQRERELVDVLGKDHITGEELAVRMKVSYSGSFKQGLSALVKRGILANNHTGYHVVAVFDYD
jgi:hypothetical protein